MYRRNVADRCGVLPLQSLEVAPSGGEAEPLSLAQVYIGLNTRQSAPAKAMERAPEPGVPRDAGSVAAAGRDRRPLGARRGDPPGLEHSVTRRSGREESPVPKRSPAPAAGS
jgi:hypothetical protein